MLSGTLHVPALGFRIAPRLPPSPGARPDRKSTCRAVCLGRMPVRCHRIMPGGHAFARMSSGSRAIPSTNLEAGPVRVRLALRPGTGRCLRSAVHRSLALRRGPHPHGGPWGCVGCGHEGRIRVVAYGGRACPARHGVWTSVAGRPPTRSMPRHPSRAPRLAPGRPRPRCQDPAPRRPWRCPSPPRCSSGSPGGGRPSRPTTPPTAASAAGPCR